MKILFTGGGTGGHVVPIIAVCREMRRIYTGKDLDFLYIGPKDDFGGILLSQEGIKIKNIFSGKIRRYLNWKTVFQNLSDIFIKIPLGILQSFFYLFFLAPDLIFSKGGFGSIPAVIAGRILLIPVFLHESDVAPGLANRFLAKFSSKIFVSFPRTEYFSPKKMILIGNPVRKEILEGKKEDGMNLFKISPEKPVILILGGSQGAQRINDKILEVLPELLSVFEIIHQCGEKNFQQIKAEVKAVIDQNLQKSYHLFPFLKEEELKQAFAVSSLVISRAGSGSVFEIAAAGKPSILIPLPESAQNHQVKNSYTYAENGAAIVIEEANFTSRFFLEKIKYIFSNPAELDKMARAAINFSKPEAAKIMAKYLLEKLTQ